MKTSNYTFITLALFSISLLVSCQKAQKINLSGEAQGTTYSISYFDNENRSFQHAVDSIFKAVDNSMSTYSTGSLISKWNRNETTQIDALFQYVMQVSKQVHTESKGYFDPTVGPLIQLYGFGKNKTVSITTAKKDSVLQFIGLNDLQLKGLKLTKKDARSSLNFNAIAQGYTVDLIRDFLLEQGVHSFMVEVGGELYCRGIKSDNSNWLIAIDKPEQNRNTEFQAFIALKDEAIATSGNYRKVQINKETGEKYIHTINPITGMATMSKLISVSIIHEDCIFADAYATAILSLGFEKGVAFLTNHPTIKAYLIYQEGTVLKSKGYNDFEAAIQAATL